MAAGSFGSGFRLGIIPGCVSVPLVLDFDVVVAGLAFPPAGGVGGAVAEIFAAEAAGGEVMVAFDDDGIVALGEGDIVPGGFHEKWGREAEPTNSRCPAPVVLASARGNYSRAGGAFGWCWPVHADGKRRELDAIGYARLAVSLA